MAVTPVDERDKEVYALIATHVLPTGIVEKRVFTPRGMIDLCKTMGDVAESFTGSNGILVNVSERWGGDRYGQTEAKMFRKGTTENLPSIITWSI